MKLKNIIYEDFVNYKKISMFILTTACSFKCEKEANCIGMCQNSELVKSKTIEIDNKILIDRYLNNDITEAVVIGGLEPLDTFEDTLQPFFRLFLVYLVNYHFYRPLVPLNQ